MKDKICLKCDVAMGNNSQYSICYPCRQRRVRPDCMVCKKKLFNSNKSGYCRKCRKRHDGNFKLHMNVRHKERMNTDPIYCLKKTLRKRFYEAMRNNSKEGSVLALLGCSIEKLKKYLENRFYCNPETGEVMSWSNQGLYGWHVDHIKPLVAFNLSDPEQQKEACHYSNLQPLWAKDNLSKGDTYAQ